MQTTQTNGTCRRHGGIPTTIRDVFTVGQLRSVLKMSHRKIATLIDGGALPGYRLPGSLDRRVQRPDLLRFMRENAIPVPPEVGGAITYHVLTFGPCRGVKELLERPGGLVGYRCFAARDTYEAGELGVLVTGDVALVDVAAGVAEATIVLDGLFRSLHWSRRSALILGTEDRAERRIHRETTEEVIPYPWSPASVAAAVCAACEGR